MPSPISAAMVRGHLALQVAASSHLSASCWSDRVERDRNSWWRLNLEGIEWDVTWWVRASMKQMNWTIKKTNSKWVQDSTRARNDTRYNTIFDCWMLRLRRPPTAVAAANLSTVLLCKCSCSPSSSSLVLLAFGKLVHKSHARLWVAAIDDARLDHTATMLTAYLTATATK